MVNTRFRFNKVARKHAIDTFKAFERNALFTGLVGAAVTDPVVAAAIALAVYLLCHLIVIYIAGLEDVAEADDEPTEPRGRKSSPTTPPYATEVGERRCRLN